MNTERRYGVWAMDPEGTPENPKKCIVEVHTDNTFGQCPFLRGHGPNGDYCKKHGAIAERKEMNHGTF